MNNKKDNEKKPFEFYFQLNYPITLYPEAAGGFTAEIRDLPGCLSQGETVEEAYGMIAEARELWLEVAYEYGDPIPMPSTEIEYSGKTMLRMPTHLHQRLAESAKQESTSLNQYIVALLSERDALNSVKTINDQLSDIRQDIQQLAKGKGKGKGKERSPYLATKAFKATPSKPSSELSN
ncbi:MAG: toxin-antitoxin system HicB family antitoxin [Phormidesmis priestleyi]|uniref:Toxin-antitoxin system HicB family antitoxin n=1 Tax=Phormidesmis priestleyi TaxID=268141 RepID=A0A2W4XTN6_9CYAN|nr:MAG: toxin-antitoxin system HicB family antitoxin [Phormidesmis priestleyi]